MATNDFQKFATGGGANVISQATYLALSALGTGFLSGLAVSAQLNKVWRQSSIISCMVAQFIVDQTGQNATDDGTTATLEANFKVAIAATSIGLAGSFRNLNGSSAGSVVTASWTVDEIIAETALGGLVYKGAGQSLSFNGATTGAGGMDTGSVPANADLSIYAIYNPSTNTWNTLGCLGTTSNGTIYSGSHMPSGYTASCLISSHVMSSSVFRQWWQRDRQIFLNSVNFLNSTSLTASPSSVSLSNLVPANAQLLYGYLNITSSVSNTLYLAANSAGTASQQQLGQTVPSAGASGQFGPLVILTAQTVWANIAGSTATAIAAVTSFTF